jgi:hypothetical protein
MGLLFGKLWASADLAMKNGISGLLGDHSRLIPVFTLAERLQLQQPLAFGLQV